MVVEYTAPILQLVRNTVSNREGIKKIVAAAEDAITKIDQDIAELATQHHNLVTIHYQYVKLYEVLMGEELRSKQEIHEIAVTPSGAYHTERLRQKIVNYAESCGKYVKDVEIIEAIGAFHWKNPKAVIATILLRSGKWKKEEPGIYARIEEEE